MALQRLSAALVKWVKKKKSTGETILEANLAAVMNGCTDNIWHYEQFVDKSTSPWNWSPALAKWKEANYKLYTVSSGNYISGGLYVPSGVYGMTEMLEWSNATTTGSSSYMSQLTIFGEGQNNTYFQALQNIPIMFWMYECRVRMQGFTVMNNGAADSVCMKFGKKDTLQAVALSSFRDMRLQSADVLLHIAHMFDSQFDQLHLTLWGKVGCLIDTHDIDNSNYLLFNRLHVETVGFGARNTQTTCFKIAGGSGSNQKHQNIQFNCLHFETVNFNCTMFDMKNCIDVSIVGSSLNRNRGSGETTPPSAAAPIMVVENVSNIAMFGGKMQHIGATSSDVSKLVIMKGNVSALSFNNVYFSTGNTAAGTAEAAFDWTACNSKGNELQLRNCRFNNFVTLPTFDSELTLGQTSSINRRFRHKVKSETRGGSNIAIETIGYTSSNTTDTEPVTQVEIYSSGCVKVQGGILGKTVRVSAGGTATFSPPLGVQNGRGHYRVMGTSNDVQAFAEFYNVPGQQPLKGLIGTTYNVGINSATAVDGKLNIYQSGNNIVLDNRTTSDLTIGVLFTAS